MSKHKRIEELENENAEYAKEILLNESAIYAVEKEIAQLTPEILMSTHVQQKINILKLMMEQIEFKNKEHRVKIYKNNFEIKSLQDEND